MLGFGKAPNLAEPPPRLHHGCLDRCVGVLKPEPQRGVFRVREVGIGLSLEGGDSSGDLNEVAGEVAGEVLGSVSVVSHLTAARRWPGRREECVGILWTTTHRPLERGRAGPCDGWSL
jgi:hypothetical protein